MPRQSKPEPKSMPTEPVKTLPDIAREVGRYPLDAFEFLHEGLDFTVRQIHGPTCDAIRALYEWMDHSRMEPLELAERAARGDLPDGVHEFVAALGGPAVAAKKLNRHVSGEQLCWGLRDLAQRRWGLLASAVLRHWGIRETMDFGRMVFALVQSGMLQKQPHDSIDAFHNVYDFETAFDRSYKIGRVEAAVSGDA